MVFRGLRYLFIWVEGYYYHFTENQKPDDRANALAVLAGLAVKEQYPGILKILQTIENASPYMEKYVLDALCEMGYIMEATQRMKKRYREMVEYDYSMLWEYWDKGGTLNHAWSGGPLITMSKYIAGIKPLDTTSSTITKPHFRCVARDAVFLFPTQSQTLNGPCFFSSSKTPDSSRDACPFFR